MSVSPTVFPACSWGRPSSGRILRAAAGRCKQHVRQDFPNCRSQRPGMVVSSPAPGLVGAVPEGPRWAVPRRGARCGGRVPAGLTCTTRSSVTAAGSRAPAARWKKPAGSPVGHAGSVPRQASCGPAEGRCARPARSRGHVSDRPRSPACRSSRIVAGEPLTGAGNAAPPECRTRAHQGDRRVHQSGHPDEGIGELGVVRGGVPESGETGVRHAGRCARHRSRFLKCRDHGAQCAKPAGTI